MKLYKTEQGQAAFKQRSTLFSARQRSLFILFDGKKPLDTVLSAAAGLGMGPADVEYLLALGFLSQNPSDLPPDTGSAPLDGMSMPAPLSSPAIFSADLPSAPAPLSPNEPPLPPRTEQERYFDAKPIATQLTAGLGLRGFMLNLAVESAAGYEDLLKLLPKIQAAAGVKACRKLERILLGQSFP
jgi:hypothetical protein